MYWKSIPCDGNVCMISRRFRAATRQDASNIMRAAPPTGVLTSIFVGRNSPHSAFAAKQGTNCCQARHRLRKMEAPFKGSAQAITPFVRRGAPGVAALFLRRAMTTAAHTFDDKPIAVPAHLSQVCAGALLAIACMACACAAHAADEQSRALAAGCASCHQPDERIPPPLAGQSRDKLSAKLRGFRNGTRSGTVMPQLARGYTPAQLDAVAAWFAAQKPSRP